VGGCATYSIDSLFVFDHLKLRVKCMPISQPDPLRAPATASPRDPSDDPASSCSFRDPLATTKHSLREAVTKAEQANPGYKAKELRSGTLVNDPKIGLCRTQPE